MKRLNLRFFRDMAIYFLVASLFMLLMSLVSCGYITGNIFVRVIVCGVLAYIQPLKI